jgi:hypothetical protein
VPLVREEFASPENINQEQLDELLGRIDVAGIALVHTITAIGDMGRYGPDYEGRLSLQCWETERAHHLQDGLPKDHEIAVWGGVRNGAYSLIQQVVKWEGEDVQEVVPVTVPRTVLSRDISRRHQGAFISDLPGANSLKPYEELSSQVQDVHDTVIFFANAFGYQPKPLREASRNLAPVR